jgi:membrane-associated protein
MFHLLGILPPVTELVNWIIAHGGLFLLLFIIFAETGLFAGFFLPGDSLLFVAGIFSKNFASHLFGLPIETYNQAVFHWHFIIILLLVTLAAILGNMVGYWFGKKSGPLLYKRNDSFFFKKKYLATAQKFFEKNGGMAIILGRFVPIVRTFAPIVAGIVQVNHQKFVKDSIIGAVAWVFGMMLSGLFLQDLFLRKFNIDLSKRIEIIALGIIFVTTAPVIYKFWKETRNAKNEETSAH